MTKAKKDYEHLQQISRHTRLLEGVQSLLNWDQETLCLLGEQKSAANSKQPWRV